MAANSVSQNNFHTAEKSPPEKIETVVVQKTAESETVTDFGRIVDLEPDLADTNNLQTSLTSSILLAGVVILSLGFVIAIFYFIPKKRTAEISYYGADLDTEKLESQKSIYLDDFGENETKDDQEGEIKYRDRDRKNASSLVLVQ